MAATITLAPPMPPWMVAPLGAGLMASAFAVAYPLSRTEPSDEGADWPSVFPSASINYPPSSDVGGLIICVAAVILSYAFLIRHAENAARLGAQHAAVNHGALAAALLGLVGGPIAVANFPWHIYPQVHYFFGYSTFYLGALYLLLQAFLDAARPETVPAWLRQARLGLVCIGLVAMFTYIALFGAVGHHSTSLVHNATAATASEACLELLCMVLLLLFVATFGVSQALAGLRLQLGATLDDVPPPPAPEEEKPSATTPLLAKGAAVSYDTTAAAASA
jgi:hypothetical protein